MMKNRSKKSEKKSEFFFFDFFFGGGGRGRAAVAPRTKYAELAPGGPSLEKKSNFLASWAFSKFHGFLAVFLPFLDALDAKKQVASDINGCTQD